MAMPERYFSVAEIAVRGRFGLVGWGIGRFPYLFVADSGVLTLIPLSKNPTS